ncbi:MAG: hypothetical protein ACYDAG_12590, partial [Chloroflexota bacterium]
SAEADINGLLHWFPRLMMGEHWTRPRAWSACRAIGTLWTEYVRPARSAGRIITDIVDVAAAAAGEQLCQAVAESAILLLACAFQPDALDRWLTGPTRETVAVALARVRAAENHVKRS